MLATASTVRAFVLVEFSGAWGRTALQDARLPAEVRAQLSVLSRLGAKALLIRRHAKASREPGVRVFACWAGPSRAWAETTVLPSHARLADIDLTPLLRGESVGLRPHDEPIVCVCTHGRHDACCAELGRPVAAALGAAHPGPAWEVSHIGGDRFAANLLVLPEGLYYGRVTPELAPGLVADHLHGLLDLDHLRGRSSRPLGVQAAELVLRRRLGERRLNGVSVTAVRRDGSSTIVDLRSSDGAEHRVTVAATRAEPAQLTCAATRLSPAPRFREVANGVVT